MTEPHKVTVEADDKLSCSCGWSAHGTPIEMGKAARAHLDDVSSRRAEAEEQLRRTVGDPDGRTQV